VVRVGYARVSTIDQDPELQLRALRDAGCERTFSEHVCGSQRERVELERAIDFCRPGDVLTVWKLDRLGRSVQHLIQILARLQEAEVHFASLTEQMDTSTPMGRLLFHVAASFAELERDVIRERTRAGLEAARAAGRMGGRPRLLDERAVTAAQHMRGNGATLREIAEALRVSKSTAHRYAGDV
jgi:DNA invertase Pin-like site-specific DNA recombinase